MVKHARRRPFWLKAVLIGVGTHVLLMVLSYVAFGSLSYFGVQSKRIETATLDLYLGIIISFVLKVTLTHVVLGAVCGLLVGRALSLLWAELPRRRFVMQTTAIAGGLLLVQLLLLWISVARYPQLYVAAFADKGGVLAAAQRAVAFHVPLWLAPALLLLLVLIWLVAELRNVIRQRQSWSLVSLVVSFFLLGAGLYSWFLQPAARAAQYAWRRAAPSSSAAPSRPNILVLAADSLRPDFIQDGTSGTRPIAPNLSRLAQEGVQFERAYTVLARTFPAWVSMLTGQYPHHHGVRHMFPSAADRAALPPTVASMLSAAGYRTAVISDYAGDVFPRADFGFHRTIAPYFHFLSIVRQRILTTDLSLMPYITNARGLALFEDLGGLAEFANPEFLTDRILDEMARLPEPWLIVAFYSSPHFPYAAPAPYFRLFADPHYQGPFRYHKQHDIVQRARTAADQQQVRDLFAGTIRVLDDQVGRMLNRMEEQQLLARTVVVTTADHGENLYEGGLGMGHGDHLRGEPGLRIALNFWGPRWIPARKRIGVAVRSIDLAPTLIELAGLRPERFTFDGVSLRELWQQADAPREDREVFLETGIWFTDRGEGVFQQQRLPYPAITETCWVDPATNHEVVLVDQYKTVVDVGKHRGLYREGYKLIYIPTGDGVRYELYHVATDPLSEHNLIDREPATAERLKARLLEIMSNGDPARLRSGYFIPRRQDPPLAPLPQPTWLRQRADLVLP